MERFIYIPIFLHSAGILFSFGQYGIIYLHVIPVKVSNYLSAYRVYNISSNSSH